MYEGRVGIYWGGTFGPERKPRAVIEPITQLPPPHPLSPPPSPEYKEEFVKYFRRQSAVLDTKLVSHVSFKMHFPGNPFVSNSALHATVHLSFSPFLRRLFNFCAPPFLTSGLLPSSASRVPPKNPPLNINGRHSVQVQGIHANAPPGHPIDSNAPRMEKNSQVNCSTLANISGACTGT